MTECDAELCEYWTGQGCACEVFGIERPELCRDCACDADEHDAPKFGGGCTSCGDCDGFR